MCTSVHDDDDDDDDVYEDGDEGDADYDDDGNREFGVFSQDRVAIYRLDEKPGSTKMTKIGEWSWQNLVSS